MFVIQIIPVMIREERYLESETYNATEETDEKEKFGGHLKERFGSRTI
jgi:hypothetical protein